MTSFFRGVSDGDSGGRGGAGAQARRRRRRPRDAGRLDHPAARHRPDLPLRRGVGRQHADPPRRRDREVGRPARDHHPRALHDGVHVVGRGPGGLRRRPYAAASGSRCASRGPCSRARRSPPRSGPRARPNGNPVFGFETRNGDGEVVIKDGLVEVVGLTRPAAAVRPALARPRARPRSHRPSSSTPTLGELLDRARATLRRRTSPRCSRRRASGSTARSRPTVTRPRCRTATRSPSSRRSAAAADHAGSLERALSVRARSKRARDVGPVHDLPERLRPSRPSRSCTAGSTRAPTCRARAAAARPGRRCSGGRRPARR